MQLTRTGVGHEALQAGSGLGLNANASQELTISASGVDGAAAAGLNRARSFEGMDMATRSLVVAQQATSEPVAHGPFWTESPPMPLGQAQNSRRSISV